LPASGAAPGDGWKPLGKATAPAGYTYESRDPNGPIRRIVVKSDRVVLTGRGQNWAYSLDETAQGAVAVRLQLGSGPTWCAMIPAGRADRVDAFLGQSFAPPPTSCPPLP
jgi:hypothetical protein